MSASNVIPLPARASRSAEVIVAEMIKLALELSAAPAARGGDALALPPASEVVALKLAAHRIGWREERLKAHIVRWSREHPDEPSIGWQVGGRRHSPWVVDLNRLRRYLGP